jgi:hypothetical protein
MSRDDGFAIADISTALYSHPRVVALARRLRDGSQTAVHVAMFNAVLLASWAAGRRLTVDEACPPWWIDTLDDVRANLQAVGLLDDEARIPDESWESWFTPAFERREARRESGRLGGQRSGAARIEASLQRRSGIPEAALNPSVPTFPTVPTGRTRPSDREGDVSATRRGSKARLNGGDGPVNPSEKANGSPTEPCSICHEPPDGTGRLVEVGGSWLFAHERCLPAVVTA